MLELNSGVALAPYKGAAIGGWPAEVELILSALESGQHPHSDRRKVRRATYRSEAKLRLFIDAIDRDPWLLYTRDVCKRGLGFIAPRYLPLGYGGMLHLLMPSGRIAKMQCTLCRCRQVSPGWYEGALNFSREQMEFDALTNEG